MSLWKKQALNAMAGFNTKLNTGQASIVTRGTGDKKEDEDDMNIETIEKDNIDNSRSLVLNLDGSTEYENVTEIHNERQKNKKVEDKIDKKRAQPVVTLNECSGDFDDPSEVSFKFIASGKSKHGVLVTNDGYFKWNKNQQSKAGDRVHYTCSDKPSSGCKARAIVETKTVKLDHGEEVQRRLVSISSYEVTKTPFNFNLFIFPHFQHHAQYHTPDPTAIIAGEIMMSLREAVQKEPLANQGNIYCLCIIQN